MSGRSSVSISVSTVLRRAGVQHPLQRRITLDALAVGEAAIPAGTPIDVDVVLEATGNAVVASGELRTVARCACRRCLEPFDEPIVAAVREIFEPRPVEGETYPLTAEHIDLVPFARDALLLSLPLAPLCRPDCPGPAPERFPTTVEDGGVRPAGDGGDPAGRDHTAGDVDAVGVDGGDGDDVDGGGGADGDGGGGVGATRPRDPRWAALDQLQLDR